jgi:hypothetical protein
LEAAAKSFGPWERVALADVRALSSKIFDAAVRVMSIHGPKVEVNGAAQVAAIVQQMLSQNGDIKPRLFN